MKALGCAVSVTSELVLSQQDADVCVCERGGGGGRCSVTTVSSMLCIAKFDGDAVI